MKEALRSRLQILSGALSLGLVSILLCISLVTLACMNQSVAWFVNNKSVNANGMVVTVGSEEDVGVSMRSYAVESMNVSARTYKRADVESYEIPTYDPSNIIYSAYEEALILVFDISVAPGTTVKLTLSNTHPDEISLLADNYLSNCLQITEVTPDANNSVMTATGATYAFVTSGDTANSAPKKSGSLTLMQREMTAKNTTVYFVLEYNMTFLNYAVDNALKIDEMDFVSDIGFSLEVVK